MACGDNDDKPISNLEKTAHKRLIWIITIILVILWLLMLYAFRSHLIYWNHLTITYLTILIPILFMIYHSFIWGKIIDDSKTRECEIDNIMYSIKSENRLTRIVPVIMFGLGVLLSRFDKHILRKTIPFLLLGLLFGSLIPLTLEHISFKQSNVYKLIVTETIDYCSESYSYGLLIAGILLSFTLVVGEPVLQKNTKMFL